jgi:hypothetical protein
MKKIFCFLLAIVFLFGSLVACKNAQTADSGSESISPDTNPEASDPGSEVHAPEYQTVENGAPLPAMVQADGVMSLSPACKMGDYFYYVVSPLDEEPLTYGATIWRVPLREPDATPEIVFETNYLISGILAWNSSTLLVERELPINPEYWTGDHVLIDVEQHTIRDYTLPDLSGKLSMFEPVFFQGYVAYGFTLFDEALSAADQFPYVQYRFVRSPGGTVTQFPFNAVFKDKIYWMEKTSSCPRTMMGRIKRVS